MAMTRCGVTHMSKTVFVTGAYGFLGRHVARAAAMAGDRVIGFGHGRWSAGPAMAWGVSQWIAGDIAEVALAASALVPDVIYHCAGSGSVAVSLDDPRRDFDRNVCATREVLEFMRRHAPLAALVLPSSAGVYGETGELPISIGRPTRPLSPYGMHKLMAEQICRSYGTNFGVRCAIVRYFSIYGPELRKQLLWDACNRLSAGDTTFGGTGDETRDWLHVSDAASLMLAAAAFAGADCPTVNGATGTAVAIRTIVAAIAREIGGGKAQFSGERRPGDPLHYRADISEATAWGWAPEVEIEQGLLEFVTWYKRHCQ